MQVDLLLDGTGVVGEPGGIGELLEALLALTKFQGDTHQPYYVHAYWGRFSFRGILTQADVTYKLFDRAGEPLRATVKLSLKEALSPAGGRRRGPAGLAGPLPDLARHGRRRPRRHRGPRLRRPGLLAPARRRQPADEPARTHHRAAAPAPAAGDPPMTTPTTQRDRPAFEVRVGGTALEPLVAADVVEVEVHEEVGRHGRLTLLVQNWDADQRAVRHSDDGPFTPGAGIAVSLGYHSDLTEVFDGVIASLTTHFPSGSPPVLRVEGRSRSVLMDHPPRSRQLADVTDADIASALAADYSLETRRGRRRDAIPSGRATGSATGTR